MSEDSEEPLLTVLFYGQLSGVVVAVMLWIAVVFGPLVEPWFFMVMAVSGLLGLARAYVGKQKNERAEQTVIQGEAGVFHALASAERPMTANALGDVLPHTVNDVEYRLTRLERKGLIGTTEKRGATYYYVKSTNPESTSAEETETADGEFEQETDDRQPEVETN